MYNYYMYVYICTYVNDIYQIKKKLLIILIQCIKINREAFVANAFSSLHIQGQLLLSDRHVFRTFLTYSSLYN